MMHTIFINGYISIRIFFYDLNSGDSLTLHQMDTYIIGLFRVPK